MDLLTVPLRISVAQLLLGLVLYVAVPGASSAEDFSQLVDFDVARSDSDALPSETDFKPIRLPDSWRQNKVAFRNAWYRTKLKLPADVSNLALYVPRLSMNIGVFIDGLAVANGGRFSEPISRNHGRPLFFFIPESVLKDKTEIVLMLRISDNPWGLGYLGPLFFGDADVLLHRYQMREFLTVRLPIGLGIVMILFALSSWYIYIKRPGENQFLWFGLAMALFSVDTINVFVTDIPVPRLQWEIYVQIVVFAFAASTILFIHRFTNTGWQKIEPLLGALLVVQVVVLAVVPKQDFFTVKNLFNMIIITYGVVLVISVARKFKTTVSKEAGVTLLAGVILLALSVHTWLIHSGTISPEKLHVIHFGAPGFFLLTSFALLRKFLGSLQETEILARTLDQRVHDRERQLIVSYEQVKQMEQRQAIAEERVRITRDMHDGFAGQLVGAIAMTESNRTSMNELSRQLRSALMDLRIMIDTLDPNTHEFAVALGMLRSRIQPLLDSRNFALLWNVDGVPYTLSLHPFMTLSILRVLQECFTNLLKYSDGSTAQLDANFVQQVSSAILKIRIWEDGKGFEPGIAEGRGLANVRKRIDAMNGKIVYQPIDHGFEIRFAIPVPTNPG